MIEQLAEGMPDGIGLRPLGDGDHGFSLALFKEITSPSFAMLGMPEDQLTLLLEQQFAIRDSQWRGRFPQADWIVITDSEGPVGECCIDVQEGRNVLVNIALSQAARGRGIAAALVRRLAELSARSGKYVSAHVIKENPAKEIWFHLGFRIVGDAGAHHEIEWRPAG